VDEGRRVPRAGYWAKRGGGTGHRLLLKEGVDACRVPAPLTFEGAADECIETGGVLLPEGQHAMDSVFGHMQRVAHDCLKAAAVALGGLTKDDLAPLLDPSPLPYGASGDDKGGQRPYTLSLMIPQLAPNPHRHT
jgi:hypothetical protein